MKTVIIGNGIAGNEVAFQLRERDPDAEITIISKERFAEYDPCSLTYFVGGDVPREVVFRRELADYERAGINLALGEKIASIDPAGKTTTSEGGEIFSYDNLVLAHGGEVFRPPISGLDLRGVFGCKELEDADDLFNRAGSAAVVIGSGAIGIEAAEALKKKGFDVTVVELLDRILPTMFDAPAAGRLRAALEGHGIAVRTGLKVLGIEGDRAVTGVRTEEETIPCDTVVLATGVRAHLGLARSAGVETDRGILVNERMETSVPDIYACGDCAQTKGLGTGEAVLYQLKHNAIDQARIVARNILGEGVEYRGAYAFARAHFFDTHSASFGRLAGSVAKSAGAEIFERDDRAGYLMVVLDNGRVVGAQAVGDLADRIGLLMGAAWRGDDIDELRRDWNKICQIGSSYPWTHRQLGELLGLATPIGD